MYLPPSVPLSNLSTLYALGADDRLSNFDFTSIITLYLLSKTFKMSPRSCSFLPPQLSICSILLPLKFTLSIFEATKILSLYLSTFPMRLFLKSSNI